MKGKNVYRDEYACRRTGDASLLKKESREDGRVRSQDHLSKPREKGEKVVTSAERGFCKQLCQGGGPKTSKRRNAWREEKGKNLEERTEERRVVSIDLRLTVRTNQGKRDARGGEIRKQKN